MEACNKFVMTDELAIMNLESIVAAGRKSGFCSIKDEDIETLELAISSIKGWRNVLKRIDDEIKEIQEHTSTNDIEAKDIIFDYSMIRRMIVDEMVEVGL